MDFKKPENILDFIKFQKSILKKYKNFIKSTLVVNYKKAAIFVYWLNDYIEYIKAEETFKPNMNITYKRGQIVFVNFGYRIGNELGGNHYAVVLDTKNSKNSKTLTVIPLKSKKERETPYSKIYHVSLEKCVKTLLYQKAFEIKKENYKRALILSNKIHEIGIEKADNDAQIKKDLALLKRNNRIAQNVIDYTNKLKNESIADIGQIITISKQRINHPCKTTDVLTNVILPSEYMDAIEAKAKQLYFPFD